MSHPFVFKINDPVHKGWAVDYKTRIPLIDICPTWEQAIRAALSFVCGKGCLYQ